MATQPNLPEDPSTNWYAYHRFNPRRDMPGDARNTLLVVAALIAAVTFQAGLNPPSSFLSEGPATKEEVETYSGRLILPSKENTVHTLFLSCNTTSGEQGVKEGSVSVVLASTQKVQFTLFLFCNTLALSASIQTISALIIGCPFSFEVLIAIYSMMATYGVSIATLEPPRGVLLECLIISFFLPFFLRLLHRFLKKVQAK